MTWNRLTMVIGTIAIVIVLIIALTPVANKAAQRYAISPDIRPADAIVVLGSGMRGNNSLSSESEERLLYGMELYKRGMAPILVVSGPPHGHSQAEAVVRARIATEMGIPESQIVELINVNTTRDEAQESARLLRSRNVHHVLLVTESMHMRRSKAVFEAAGFVVSAAPSDDFQDLATTPLERLDLCGKFLMHSAGLLYYRLAGYI